ncbi:helix-turn-helix transcriptional regulator [Kitasatospora sp. NBC_01287]|uniref:helix-turn-helix domain-containing protein n=1 Tax=Kitasatospora sp. NBC_01287 TaxID=2903573 RepID=UPI0022510871|nr:helix-turn-helix transcriptional regulator [Kitasatospora sp. NBC_01287]MCX4747243.1 helix-turn-helix transcriptional regulator [Kitasatospora sp. NBC_01287]
MPGPKELDPTVSLEAYFGAQVRKRRERKGWTQKELGARVFLSHNRIAQIELATDPPGRELVMLLDAALDAEGDLVDLWTHIGAGRIRNYAQLFLLRQGQARIIQEYGLVIPGLVQVEGYIRAMFAAGEAIGEPPVAEMVPIRLGRQEIFEREDPPWYRLTLDESALYRNVGGPEVMRIQLLRLLKLGARPRVEVQVVPFGALDLSALGGSLCLLTMPDGSRAAYTEGLKTGQFFDKPDDVAQLTLIYDRIQAAALSPEMSAVFIRNVIEERYSWDLPPLT